MKVPKIGKIVALQLFIAGRVIVITSGYQADKNARKTDTRNMYDGRIPVYFHWLTTNKFNKKIVINPSAVCSKHMYRKKLSNIYCNLHKRVSHVVWEFICSYFFFRTVCCWCCWIKNASILSVRRYCKHCFTYGKWWIR